MTPRRCLHLQVFVAGVSARSFLLRVQGATTISDTRSLIEAEAGWQLSADAVLSSGKHGNLTVGGATLHELGIGNNSTIIVSLRACGGGCAHSTNKKEDGLGEVTFHDIDVGGKEPTEPVSSFTVQAYRVPAQPPPFNL